MANDVPNAIKWAYQDKHYDAGLPHNTHTVFDALVSPPTSGVAAVAASVASAQDVGIIAPDATALKGRIAHIDRLKEFYDSASIQH
jgi:hypothetical protein